MGGQLLEVQAAHEAGSKGQKPPQRCHFCYLWVEPASGKHTWKVFVLLLGVSRQGCAMWKDMCALLLGTCGRGHDVRGECLCCCCWKACSQSFALCNRKICCYWEPVEGATVCRVFLSQWCSKTRPRATTSVALPGPACSSQEACSQAPQDRALAATPPPA